MATYIASLSDGRSFNGGGETTIQAETMDMAWADAVEWAKGGEYPEAGCRIAMRVSCPETGLWKDGYVTIDAT